MTRFQKLIIAAGLFLGGVVAAVATTTTYQYKDNLGNTFNILLWQCVSGPQYCTGMVLEDSSGNEKGTSGNPLSISDAVDGATTDVPCTLPASATACSKIAIAKATANAANGALAGQSGLTVPIGQVGPEVNVPPTDCSGTITSGGGAQTLIAASATLHGFIIKNIDGTTGSGESLWFSLTGTAVAGAAGSYQLLPPTSTYGGDSFAVPFGTSHAVSIIGATSAHKFSCTSY